MRGIVVIVGLGLSELHNAGGLHPGRLRRTEYKICQKVSK